MITDVELDVFVEFCQSIGHLKNNSERKESSDVETARERMGSARNRTIHIPRFPRKNGHIKSRMKEKQGNRLATEPRAFRPKSTTIEPVENKKRLNSI